MPSPDHPRPAGSDELKGRLSDAGRRAGDTAEQASSQVQANPAYRWLVTLGLVAFGVIHLLVGWISLQLALRSGGGEASNQGALQDLAAKPFGAVLLVLIAVGMVALVVWQVIEAAFGHTQFSGRKRTVRRVSSAGRVVVYAALAYTAGRIVLGAGAASSNQAPQTATGTLMSQPFGRVLVAVLGAVVVAVGASQVVKGVRRKFVEEDLEGSVPQWATRIGSIGWTAKGIALAIAGLLIAWATITADPQKAAGLDGALKTLQQAPFGSVLLGLMGLGFVAFAAYCFVWSHHARHEHG